MRRLLVPVALAAVLSLAAGCGGDEDSLGGREVTAAQALAAEFQGNDPTATQRDMGACLGKELVRRAGVDRLVSSGMLTEDLAFNDDLPEAVPAEVVSAYADAVVACKDPRAELEERRTLYPDATDDDVDAYAECMEAIDDELLRAAVVESASRGTSGEASRAYLEATEPCTQDLGQPKLD